MNGGRIVARDSAAFYFPTPRSCPGTHRALGAPAREVLRLVLREAMMLAAIGIVAGIVLSLFVTRLLRSLLFQVSPTDATTFAVTAALLAMVALAASYIPARRATQVEPSSALRTG